MFGISLDDGCQNLPMIWTYIENPSLLIRNNNSLATMTILSRPYSKSPDQRMKLLTRAFETVPWTGLVAEQ